MDQRTETTQTAESSDIYQLLQQLQDEGIEPAEWFDDLAVEAYEEFTKRGGLDLIDCAVTMSAFAVQMAPEDSGEYVGLLNNHGAMLGTRYERTGDMVDLEAAIPAAQQAVDSTSGDHPNRTASALDESLVHEFESILDQINAPLLSHDNNVHLEQAQQRRRDSVTAFDSCIRKIRNIQGYERFLLGLTVDKMRACASEGPIIIVNVTDIGGHAIIVSSSGVKSLALSKLSSTDVRKWLNRTWDTGPEGIESENRDFREYLGWL